MGNSRTADKFVVRMPDGVLVVQAIEEKLARALRQELLLDALELAATGHADAQVQAVPRLIGWRSADYLMETADRATADSWSVHVQILPIFEGDTITKLPGHSMESSA